MTEQELREKFINLSAAQLKEFGVEGSPYLVNRFAVLVWKKLQTHIAQYGDTRERLGRRIAKEENAQDFSAVVKSFNEALTAGFDAPSRLALRTAINGADARANYVDLPKQVVAELKEKP